MRSYEVAVTVGESPRQTMRNEGVLVGQLAEQWGIRQDDVVTAHHVYYKKGTGFVSSGQRVICIRAEAMRKGIGE